MIPTELTERKQWCVWRDVDGNKIPLTPALKTFRSNDPETFATYDEARASGERIAWVFAADDPYVGIDLDNCLDERGELRQWAIPIVSKMLGISYGEISPSGTGIKFITRGKKPSDARCVHRFAGEKQQIEMYEKARFWAMTDNIYFDCTQIGDGQAAIDWLCQKFLGATAPEPEGQALGNLGSFNAADYAQQTSTLPLAERMRLYASAAELPGEGGRNSAAFRLAGHLFSMEENGFHPPEPFVLDLVQQWNARLPAPMTSTEVERVVHSASKNGTPPPPKVSTPTIVESTADYKLPSEPVKPPSREAFNPPGFLSDVVEYTLATSLYPQPELALGAAIALLGTITGRKLTDCYNTRTNVYVVGLAPTGAGKERAREVNKDILVQAGATEHFGNERLGSHAGLIVALEEKPALLFQLDEIGRMLATMTNPRSNPHLFNIATVLTTLYSQSGSVFISDAYADNRKTKTIHNPHPCIYGTTVPDYYWGSLTRDSVMDGMVGRILPFEAVGKDGSGYVDFQEPDNRPIPESILAFVKRWKKYAAGNVPELKTEPIVAEHTPAAKARMVEHMKAASSRLPHDDSGAVELWARAAGRTGKLALIFAASRAERPEDTRIELNDVDRAIELSNFITRRVCYQVRERISENDTEDRRKRVMRTIAEAGGRITKNELTRRTRWLKGKERDEIIKDCVEAEELAFETEETGGRVRTVYVRTG